jgi:hypothetical protein
MTVRAKLHLKSETTYEWGGKKLTFETRYDTTIPEDQRFQKATPSGSIEMQIDNPIALEQFKLGGDYYVDFTPVPAEAAKAA